MIYVSRGVLIFPFSIFQVKYGDTLKRFNGYVNGTHFTLNLSALRSKIASAFKFGPDVDFILTYTDDDGDIVMLDDDEDLHDAAIHQKLNPLRISVKLKNSHTSASQTDRQDLKPAPLRATTQDPLAQIKSVIDEALKPISEPLRSTAREDPLGHIKAALEESLKAIHEPIPESLAKLSREALDAAPPQLAELIKPFVNLITSTNSIPAAGHARSPSGSSSGVQQEHMDFKADDQPKGEARVSRPLKARTTGSSEIGGLKNVLVDAPVEVISEPSQGQRESLYPPLDKLVFTSNPGADTSACKGMSDAHSKGKSVMPSAAPSAPPTVCSFRPSPPLNARGNEWSQPPRWHDEWSMPRSFWQPEAIAKPSSDPRWRVPMHKAPHPSPPVPHAPLGYGHCPRFPYPGRLLSAGRLYGDLGNNSESLSRASHRWIQCDGCGVQPIVGPRYKSNV
jgi:next-to-BRCA1 protein 1